MKMSPMTATSTCPQLAHVGGEKPSAKPSLDLLLVCKSLVLESGRTLGGCISVASGTKVDSLPMSTTRLFWVLSFGVLPGLLFEAADGSDVICCLLPFALAFSA